MCLRVELPLRTPPQCPNPPRSHYSASAWLAWPDAAGGSATLRKVRHRVMGMRAAFARTSCVQVLRSVLNPCNAPELSTPSATISLRFPWASVISMAMARCTRLVRNSGSST